MPVVTETSAARYFGEGEIVGGSDHFSIAKPLGQPNDAHSKLVSFYTRQFLPQAQRAAANKQQPKVTLMDTYEIIYERRRRPGEMNSHVIQRKLASLKVNADNIFPIHGNWEGEEKVAKQNSDLIIVHYSAIASAKRLDETERQRVKRFLEAILQSTDKTKIIVYSRRNDRDAPLDAEIKRMVPPKHRDRVIGYPVYKYESRYATFNNDRVSDGLIDTVKRALALSD